MCKRTIEKEKIKPIIINQLKNHFNHGEKLLEQPIK